MTMPAAAPLQPPLTLERCDPGGVLRTALAEPSGPGLRDLWLGWVLTLPGDIDAAAAAELVLRTCARPTLAPDLEGLLQETVAFPRQRLAAMATGRRAAG
jgi:hypothetical protein